jgi:hypothetical protein
MSERTTYAQAKREAQKHLNADRPDKAVWCMYTMMAARDAPAPKKQTRQPCRAATDAAPAKEGV